MIIVQSGWNLYVLLTWSSIQTKAAEQYLSIVQEPVEQKVDNAIHWINLYAADSAIGFLNTYPLDIVIYPVDSAIQRLNNWGLIANRQFYLKTKLSVLIFYFNNQWPRLGLQSVVPHFPSGTTDKGQAFGFIGYSNNA